MKNGQVTLTGGQSSRAIGVVSGFVLKLARQSAALTQEKLAEVLAVDVTTVQGWESGRRPRHLREAVEADQVLSTGITAGARWVDADIHPLAVSVHRKPSQT